MKPTIKFGLIGFCAGILNGLFGAGGGMVVVPLLQKSGVDPKKSHATSIAIIAALSLISSVAYFSHTDIKIMDLLWFIPAGIVGAIIGCCLLKKINVDILKRIFGAVMIISSIRLLIK